MNIHSVVFRPIVTEKGVGKKDLENTLCFEVAPEANKVQIKAAVEKLFKVKVSAVRTVAPMPVSTVTIDGEKPQLSTRDVVWVSVSDSGIGIKLEDMPRLFKEFSQVDSSSTRAAQGTGLGLALCKRFVELHGGQIGVESIYGKGSTFWFLVPVDGPPKERA